jgi:hypothetical protein
MTTMFLIFLIRKSGTESASVLILDSVFSSWYTVSSHWFPCFDRWSGSSITALVSLPSDSTQNHSASNNLTAIISIPAVTRTCFYCSIEFKITVVASYEWCFSSIIFLVVDWVMLLLSQYFQMSVFGRFLCVKEEVGSLIVLLCKRDLDEGKVGKRDPWSEWHTNNCECVAQ